jgi:hypothetical protein
MMVTLKFKEKRAPPQTPKKQVDQAHATKMSESKKTRILETAK